MRNHVIAACFTAVVLSSGLVSPLRAHTPGKIDTTKGFIGPAEKAEFDDLKQLITALRSRVSALESEVAKMERSDPSTPKIAAKFQAPFTVVDENGKSIFSVSDDQYTAAFRGRVHVGPGSAGNYNMWFHNPAGVMMATIGESKTGSGLVAMLKGGREMASMDEGGFSFANSTGREITHLGPDPANSARARLVVRGTFHIQDANGNTTVDAGTLADGAGAVRTWPNADCKKGGLDTCIKGIP